MVREPILLRSVLHDREIEVALTMARIEPLSTQPGPLGDIRSRLFNHLVGKHEQVVRNGEAECIGGLEVDDQIEFGRLHHR